MDSQLDEDISQLRQLTTAQLQLKYYELFGHTSHPTTKVTYSVASPGACRAGPKVACRSAPASTPGRSPRMPTSASARQRSPWRLKRLEWLLHGEIPASRLLALSS